MKLSLNKTVSFSQFNFMWIVVFHIKSSL